MNSKKISVMTSDGQKFELEEHLAMESATIKAHLDDLPDAETVLLPEVKSWEMVKVIEFFTKLRELETKFGVKFMETKEDHARFLEAFQDEFDKEVSNESLVCLLCAVNFLEIEVLLEIMCRLMAERTKNKTLEYCRDLFGVQSDYTPEEEAKIRSDYCWAFEGSEIEEYKNDMQNNTARRHESENTRVSMSVPIITSTSHKAANTKSTQPAKVYRPAAAKHSSATRGQNYSSRQQPDLRWVRKN